MTGPAASSAEACLLVRHDRHLRLSVFLTDKRKAGDIHRRLTLTAPMNRLIYVPEALATFHPIHQASRRRPPDGHDETDHSCCHRCFGFVHHRDLHGLISMPTDNQAFADIDVQLRQRHDLISDLVETVKGYAAHDTARSKKVAKARNAAVAAQGTPQQATAENALSGDASLAPSEASPDLEANADSSFRRRIDRDRKHRRRPALLRQSGAGDETGIERFAPRLVRRVLGLGAEGILRPRRRTQTVGGRRRPVLERSHAPKLEAVIRSSPRRRGPSGSTATATLFSEFPLSRE